MIILITGPDTFVTEDAEQPEVGTRYALEDATEGTGPQNRSFHPLLEVYYQSGLWSYQGSGYQAGATLEEFKDMVKRSLGCGFESYLFASIENGKAFVRKVKTKEEIPEELFEDPDWQKMVIGKLKSWAKYTKKERTRTINNLIAEMIQVGVTGKRFNEILDGMEKGKQK